jgi:hypothetical protein
MNESLRTLSLAEAANEAVTNPWEDRIDKLKSKSTDMRDKFENANDHIKDYCNSIRNSLQLQIEYQTVKLNKLYEEFFTEIDSYEGSCIRNFTASKEFREKFADFLSRTSGQLSKTDTIKSEEALASLEEDLKLKCRELEDKKFQNSTIEFVPNGLLFNAASVGHFSYKQHEIKLPSLYEMTSLDLQSFCDDLTQDTKINVSRLNSGEILVAYANTEKHLQLLKFNSLGNLVKKVNGFMSSTKISDNFKMCVFDSKLYLNIVKIENNRHFLLNCNTSFNIYKMVKIEESIHCITANGDNVFCMTGSRLSILVYNEYLTFQKYKLSLDPQDFIFPPIQKKPDFYQMEAFDGCLLLLRIDEIAKLDATSGTIIKQAKVNALNFKCLDGDFLLLNIRGEEKLAVYDMQKEEVTRVKKYDKRVRFILDNEQKYVTLFCKDDFMIYF